MLHELRTIVQAVNQASTLNAALDELVHRTKEALATDCCSVYLADYQAQHMLLMATDGLDRAAVGHTAIGFSEGLVGLVGQREEPINVANAHAHPRFKYAPEVKEESLRAFLGTPIIHQRKVLGVMSVQQHKARQFSDQEESFLVTLAAQLATVLAHAKGLGALEAAVRRRGRGPSLLQGIAGSPGVVIAPVWIDQPIVELDDITEEASSAIDAERHRFSKAVEDTRYYLENVSSRMTEQISRDIAAIFDVYLHMLDPAALTGSVLERINQGWTAESALKQVCTEYCQQFAAMDAPYLRERASDVRDLAHRVLLNLQRPDTTADKLPERFVLVAEEVTASMLADMPRERMVGLVSLRGATNSHAAILSRALGIPAVLGLTEASLSQLAGQEVILDGYTGQLHIAPGEALRTEYLRLLSEEQALQQQFESDAEGITSSVDGQLVHMRINSGLAADTERWSELADGVGLYRTEIPFMLHDKFPSEEAQYQDYRRVLERFPKGSVNMRTLDIGGDKSLPYFPISEDNPFLGWRGIRVTLDHPEIFLVQVRAMLRASIGLDNLRIMFPMISGINEVIDARRLVRKVYDELVDELADSGKTVTFPQLGIMIEVPSILYQLEALHGLVDFVSVGSNDLTQYLLAVDRNNPRVADHFDTFHPAVMAVLRDIAQRCQALGLNFSICGELAGDVLAIPLLLAFGYRRLSMNAANLPRAKWLIRRLDIGQWQACCDELVQAVDGATIRGRVRDQLQSMGFEQLVRTAR